MSDTGVRGREWYFYLDDMIAFARNVQNYTDGLDQADFVGNRLVYEDGRLLKDRSRRKITRLPGIIRAGLS